MVSLVSDQPERERELKTIHIEIAGPWDAPDFINLFSALQAISYAFSVLEIESHPRSRTPVTTIELSRIFGHLRVKQISYASPGWIDLEGFTKSFVNLGNFLSQIPEIILRYRTIGLQKKKIEAELLALDISNTKSLMDLINSADLPERERRKYQRQILNGVKQIGKHVEYEQIRRISTYM